MSRSVAVIGGGLAGLSAALRLASRGVEVTLYEQASRLGGKAGEVRVDGFRFDTGPSVVTLPQVVETALREGGAATLPRLEPVAPLGHYRLPSGRSWTVHADARRSAAGLPPDQGAAYLRLLDDARRLYRGAAPTFVLGPAPGPAALLRYGVRHGWRAHPGRSLPQLLRSRGAGPDLEAFFLRFATYVGADPFRAPAVLHNVAWVELGLGVVHPRGGVRALVVAFEEALRQRGVRIRTATPVRGVETERGRAVAVHTDSERQPVDGVVAALDVVGAHALLGRRHRAATAEPSLSGFVLLLGVEGRRAGAAQHAVWFPPRYAAEFEAVRGGRLPADPTLYANVSARSDPEDAPEGYENWFVMANAPALSPGAPGDDPLAAAWPAVAAVPTRGRPALLAVDGGEPTPSERAYAHHLLDRLEERGAIGPGQVRTWRVLSARHLARSGHRGAIYGPAPVGLLGSLRPAPRVRGVRRLTLAGGTVHPGGGIPLVVLSGRRAADALLEARW